MAVATSGTIGLVTVQRAAGRHPPTLTVEIRLYRASSGTTGNALLYTTVTITHPNRALTFDLPFPQTHTTGWALKVRLRCTSDSIDTVAGGKRTTYSDDATWSN
jgi:hypothetical protein